VSHSQVFDEDKLAISPFDYFDVNRLVFGTCASYVTVSKVQIGLVPAIAIPIPLTIQKVGIEDKIVV
jgi:hypothetical protein